jgi:integrase
MLRVFRVTFTKPLPPGAELLSVRRKVEGRMVEIPSARFKDRRGRTVTAPLTEDGTRIRLESSKWYGRVPGEAQPVPLATDETAAELMLAELIRKAELAAAGVVDRFEKHRTRPLAEHLAEWEAALLAEGSTPKHVRQTVACARRVLTGCGFVFWPDLSASRVVQYLAELRDRKGPAVELPPIPEKEKGYTKAALAEALRIKPHCLPGLVRRLQLQAVGQGKARRYPRETAEALAAHRRKGRSVKTSNLYLDAIKQFCGWLVQDRRAPDNPLAHLSGGTPDLDKRHDRRSLPLEELRRVLGAARASERTFRGLTGPDRALLYAVAAASGFRASELAALTPDRFALDDQPPTVTLPAAFAKNRKRAVQPLPPDVAAALRTYLAGRPVDATVWPGQWADNAADMLRIDLEAAQVPYAVEGRDGPLYADFHALRHSYVALLDRSGATLKEAMQLARHSDPKLTMARYGRAQLHDLAEAVRRLPSLLSGAAGTEAPALRPTGTGDGPLVVRLSSACHAAGPGGVQQSPVGAEGVGGGENDRGRNPFNSQGVAAGEVQQRPVEEAPRVGLEPTTNRLTAGCSTIELSGKVQGLPPQVGGGDFLHILL